MGGEHAHRPLGHFGVLLHEDRPALAQRLHDVLVVDDLLADVDRRAVDLQGPFDRLDRPVDARAIATGGCQQQLLDRVRHGLIVGAGELP